MNRVVIVGAGLAGHRAAHTLRKQGFTGELVIVGNESHAPYDRPPLSKQLLAGKFEQARVTLPGPEIACTWRLGAAATGLDPGAGVVEIDGVPLAYDGLIIATGRRARPWPDLPPLTGFHMLRTLEDSLALRAAVSPETKVAIVGAGFIGCEVAATLRGLGVEAVTLIDVAAHPMPVLGEIAGRRAAATHEAHGVQMRLSSGVSEFSGSGGVEGVTLTDGERIPADLVLLATGSLPNTDWLQGSGLELIRGNVVCDEHCYALGAERIAVAGDMAAFPHPHADGPVVVEHWSNAREMGALAAANLLAAPGDREPYRSVPTFWSDQYELKVKSAGLLAVGDRMTVVEDDPEQGTLVLEAHRGEQLVGALGFNRARAIVDYQRRLADSPGTG